MQCPTDGSTLTMSERSGIEIDYCPTCRGVWLDRGELDKIIERSLGQGGAPQQSQYDQRDQRDQRDHDESHKRGYQQPHGKKRKESWLSELFE